MIDPFVAGLATRFRARALADCAQLRVALAHGDRAKVRSIAHGLSGTAGTFGFAEVSALAGALEVAVDAGQDRLGEAAQSLINELEALA